MKKRETLSSGEKLLAQVLEECLEEDLSFVPPEREIARKHKFSEKFEESMRTLLEHSSLKRQEREIQRHFHPRYAHLAACILVLCVCGWLFWSVAGPLNDGGTKESAAVTSDTAAETAEEYAESEEAMEPAQAEEPAEGAVPEDAGGIGQESGASEKGQKEWCGQTVCLAEQQEVPDKLDNVTTLVNCPVLDENDPVLYLTIGNVGEEPIRYLNSYALEVWLEDGWYVVPSGNTEAADWAELEAGMAVDEEIDLSDYQIDYGAQQYRLVVRLEKNVVSAEFTFQEVFTEKMEKLEEETSSGD